VGHSFEDDDRILNYRPQIDFVEPPTVEFDSSLPATDNLNDTIGSERERTQQLIDKYDAVEKLAGLAQKRIDARVKGDGGITIELDPVKDISTIGAIQRQYPDQDPNKITYDMYKKCLDCIRVAAQNAPGVTTEDILTAKSLPFKTDFGGYSIL